MKKTLILLIGIFLCQLADAQEVAIDLSRKGAPVAKTMFGTFLEEINHSCDGGLYAELVRNRSFEDGTLPEGYHVKDSILVPPPVINHETGTVKHIADSKMRWDADTLPGWHLLNASTATMRITSDSPRYSSAPHNLEISVTKQAILENEGFWGMNFEKGKQYKFRYIAKTSNDFQGTIEVSLIDCNGNPLATCTISPRYDWTDQTLALSPSKTDPAGCLRLCIKGRGKVWLDYVSLFPADSYKGRENGMRRDLAEMIEGLHPTFMRWPGGTIVGGISLSTRLDWKEMLGDPAARPGQIITWGYRNSFGIGYHEMLQFCEDLECDMMFVCNMGMGDMFRMADICPEDSIQYYIDDCLNAIEYAIGDVSTTWGKKRAEAGHPKPFRLKYVELGNELRGKEYYRRFPLFYNAIHQRYPQLILICNEQEFNPAEARQVETQIIDPHFYLPADKMRAQYHLFDKYPRGHHLVYVGEYACNAGVGTGNMNAALAEAAFLAGMERNGDLVTMTSYAPLLENINNNRWPVNLIRFNSSQVIGRSSYYVQQMSAENRPDYNVWNSKSETHDTLHFIASGIDESTGELIVKVVNASAEPYSPAFNILGSGIAPQVKATVLKAETGTDENTPDNPRLILPQKAEFPDYRAHCTYTFASFSYTVLRFKSCPPPNSHKEKSKK